MGDLMDWGKILDNLKTSLKFNKRVWMTFLYDISFYFVTFVLIMAMGAFLKWRSGAIGLNEIMTQPTADLQLVHGTLAGFLMTLIISIIVVYIIYLKLFAYFKGKIWFTLAEKKLTYERWKKILGMSAIILSPILILFLIMIRTVGTTNALGVFILFPIINHFLTLQFLNFTKKRKFWKTIGRGFKQSFTLIPKLIIPYAIIFVILWLLNRLFNAIYVYSVVYSISVMLIYLIAVTWIRYYIYLTIDIS